MPRKRGRRLTRVQKGPTWIEKMLKQFQPTSTDVLSRLSSRTCMSRYRETPLQMMQRNQRSVINIIDKTGNYYHESSIRPNLWKDAQEASIRPIKS